MNKMDWTIINSDFKVEFDKKSGDCIRLGKAKDILKNYQDHQLSGVSFIEEIVTDDMIEKYISENNFINTNKCGHRGWFTDPPEHHAQRVASLVNLMRTGTKLNNIIVYCKYVDETISIVDGIDDGWHRLRAGLYCDIDLSFIFDFD